jgi:hypothetical protein
MLFGIPISRFFLLWLHFTSVSFPSLHMNKKIKLIITNDAFLQCKEQQHSQKQEFFVVMVQLKLLLVFKPAGLAACVFFSNMNEKKPQVSGAHTRRA